MIDDINLKNAEVSVILTTLFDEIQRIYNLEEKNYELNLLKDSLITSLYMM